MKPAYEISPHKITTTIGTCSICKGPVQIARILGNGFTDPACGACGAVPRHEHGPVIETVMPASGPRRA